MQNRPAPVASPTLHASIGFTIAVFAAIIAMAVVLRVEVVATGIGRVVPSARVQVVQPEFGGQITAIHVRNGDRVTAGAVLIELDPTDALAELSTTTAEMARLRIERARIERMLALLEPPEPEAGHAAPSFAPPAGLAAHPYLAEQQRLLVAEYEDYRAASAQIAARLETNRRSIAVSQAMVARVEAALETRRERMDATQRLMEQGATSRSLWLEMLEGFRNLENEREIVLRELDTKVSQEAALLAERQSLRAGLRNRLLQRLNEIDARRATLSAQLATLDRRVAAARLLAPVDGIVDQLDVHTIGGVARPGQELVRIVPQDGAIEIEAMFGNADIGFLQLGQKANIRLDAFPSERFGVVTGQVSEISADSIDRGEGQFVYRLRATPDEPALQVGETAYPLRPGMTLTMDVITDDRRIISYFFAPIIEVIQRSLGER